MYQRYIIWVEDVPAHGIGVAAGWSLESFQTQAIQQFCDSAGCFLLAKVHYLMSEEQT